MGQLIAWMVCNIWSSSCQRGPTQGWLARRLLLPYFPWCVQHGWISSLLVYIGFQRYNITPWIFAFSGLSAVSDLGSLSRSPLRYQGSFLFLNVSDVSEGFPKLSGETCGHLRAIWLDWSTDIFSAVTYIFTGFIWYFNCAILAVVLFDSCLLFPWVKGAPKFLKGLLRVCEKFPGKFSPFLLVSYFFCEEDLQGLSSLLSYGITSVAVLPLHSVEEYRIK